MNKTISINLSGMLFNLEELAYEKLSKYLAQLKRSFEGTQGKDEILADIESRIAELFTEMLKNKQVILEKEVDEVIAVLGAPEEYETEKEDYSNTSSRTNANYEYSDSRRLFRDPENSVFGGVCSGVGHYFGIDAVWLRLAFVIALFFAGTGPLLYIILWIVLPKANTTAEKLQMRGERVNIENIEKKIREETERIKVKAGEFGNKARNELNNANVGARVGGFVNEFLHLIFNFIKGITKVIGRTLGLFLLLAGGMLLLALIGAFATKGIFFTGNEMGGMSVFKIGDFLDVFFESGLQQDLFIIGVVLLLITPVIGLILLGLRLVIYPRVSLTWPASVNGMLFIAGLVLCIVTGAMLLTDFSAKGRRIDPVEVRNTKSDTLRIAVQPNSELNIKQFAHIDNWRFYLDDEDHFITGRVRLNIIKSQNEELLMSVNRSARGTDKKQAIETANKIKFFVKQENNTLYFNPYFTLPGDSKWRRQRLEFTLEMPEGSFIYIDKGLEKILNDIPNTQNMDDDEMSGHTWIMGKEGLSCLSCPIEETIF
jgi:phage shock protein PspC (stress-responsive transcriptional regulator)